MAFSRQVMILLMIFKTYVYFSFNLSSRFIRCCLKMYHTFRKKEIIRKQKIDLNGCLVFTEKCTIKSCAKICAII